MGRRRALTRERVVIVGGGRAGVSAAAELRRSGFRGEVLVLSEEPDPPYHRPSCSKGLLTGNQLPSDVGLGLRECADVHWLLSRRAVALDPAARVVQTDTGESYLYDGLVIATGSHAVTPPHVPMDQPGIHVLHRLADAWALRRDLRDADSVAIVGAGLTGCETAWAVRSLARECVLIDSKPQVMTRALGSVAGRYITDQMRRERVELRLERRVLNVQRRRNGQWWLSLNDGSDVVTDLVVMTTGERPDTAWLRDADGLDITDGVLCDETLRVVGADGIVAAGTVARWPNLRNGTTPRRTGQWITALQQGHAAARALLAGDDPVPPVTPLDRLWSDQFGLRIQVAGEIDDARAEVRMTQMRAGRRDVARSGLLVSYVKRDRLVGLVAVNAARAFTAVTRSLLLAEQPVPLTGAGHLDLAEVDRAAARRTGAGRAPATTGTRDRGAAGGRQLPRQPQYPAPLRPAAVRPAEEWPDDRRHPAEVVPDVVGGPAERQPVPATRRHGVEPAERQPQRRTPRRQTSVEVPDVIRRQSAVRGTTAHRRGEAPYPAEQADVIWRESTVRGRARTAKREPLSQTAVDEPDVVRPRPTVRDHRPEQEPESWSYT